MKTLKKTAKKRHFFETFFEFFPRIGIRCFWKVFGNCTCWSLDQHSKFGVSQRIASVPTTPTPKMSPPPLKSGRYRPSIGPPGQMYPRFKCRQADLNSWGYKVFLKYRSPKFPRVGGGFRPSAHGLLIGSTGVENRRTLSSIFEVHDYFLHGIFHNQNRINTCS